MAKYEYIITSSATTGFLQCVDTVGWVICPVKIVPEMTNNVGLWDALLTHP